MKAAFILNLVTQYLMPHYCLLLAQLCKSSQSPLILMLNISHSLYAASRRLASENDVLSLYDTSYPSDT